MLYATKAENAFLLRKRHRPIAEALCFPMLHHGLQFLRAGSEVWVGASRIVLVGRRIAMYGEHGRAVVAAQAAQNESFGSDLVEDCC